jgi:hypothetical protein
LYSLALLGNTRDCVVTITSINNPSFVINAITKKGVFSWIVVDARDYVVTIGGIKCVRVENAISAPSTSNYIVTSKSISNAIAILIEL